jgi:acetyltransferase-like isoleucine patch superfamily enzyme
MGWYRYLATSEGRFAQFARRSYRGVVRFTLPAPRVVVRPALAVFVATRFCLHFCKRLFVVEPLLKAYCKKYGRRLTADIYIPWISGKGDIILGDNVKIDGYIGINFAARYSEAPALTVGDNTGIGHLGSFVVANSISIGNDCRIAGGVSMFDSSGHPTDPVARRAGEPAPANEVRPIRIDDNVWIGARATIFPGVTIGTGSVVSAGAVVMSDVPPYTVVAGNPARKVAALAAPPQ